MRVVVGTCWIVDEALCGWMGWDAVVFGRVLCVPQFRYQSLTGLSNNSNTVLRSLLARENKECLPASLQHLKKVPEMQLQLEIKSL